MCNTHAHTHTHKQPTATFLQFRLIVGEYSSLKKQTTPFSLATRWSNTFGRQLSVVLLRLVFGGVLAVLFKRIIILLFWARQRIEWCCTTKQTKWQINTRFSYMQKCKTHTFNKKRCDANKNKSYLGAAALLVEILARRRRRRRLQSLSMILC